MTTKLCVPITAATSEEAIDEIKEAEKYADLTELRIDFIKDISNEKVGELLASTKKETIVSCRRKKDNGHFTGGESRRIGLLREAISSNSNYVDIESDSKNIKDMIDNKKNTRIIASYHDFMETPDIEELEEIYARINESGPDLVKIATFANSINDNFAIFELLQKKRNLIAFCMGVKGHISRILAPKYGSYLTFASFGKNKESAPGQIDVHEMKDAYNFSLINGNTKVLGVIGASAEDSQSRYLHNANFLEKRMDFVYVPFKTGKAELEDFIANFRKFNFAGAAVTVPHKEAVMKYIDEADETAREIGAINTITNKDKKLIGYNTDYSGAVEALKERTELQGKKVLIIGAGGAARAIAYGLKKEKSIVTIANRTGEKAAKLAGEFGINSGDMAKIKELIAGNEIIINTTSAGMYPDTDSSAAGEEEFSSGKLVMDIVYKPIMTKFIKNAEKSHCSIITGDRMLVNQAIGQFRIWTGMEPDPGLMESSLSKITGRAK